MPRKPFALVQNRLKDEAVPRTIAKVSQSTEHLSLFTIGHSTHPIERFLELLQMHEIQAIADVRSSPFSRFNPQYNQDNLSRRLRSAGLYYVFLGHELGARRAECECYVGNKVSYELVERIPLFQHGIERLVTGAKKMKIAIMCAEKDPLTCHRTILVANSARRAFENIFHIREDGSIETQEAADERLLATYRAGEYDFFRPRDERLREAYHLRAEEIAYEENVQSAVS